MSSETLLDQDFVRRLGRLDLVSRRIFAGRFKGDRRSKRKGSSVEFADFRPYAQGDDLRFVDWHIFGRLDKLFLKLFLEEEDLYLHLLVDCSRSMDFGQPNKFQHARRVAAALSYIALLRQNRLVLAAFAAGLAGELPPLRGRHSLARALDFLGDLPAGGETDFPRAARDFALRHNRPGILVVISDFLDRHGALAGFRFLLGRRYDVFALQILEPGELDPPLAGELRLTDSEDQATVDLSAGRALLRAYRRNLAAYQEELRAGLARQGAGFLAASTALPFDELVLTYLRGRGLLR